MNIRSLPAAISSIAASLILALAATVAAADPTPSTVAVSAGVAAVSADSVTVLWRLDMASGWHVYGRYRNDTGFPPTIDLDLPDGWSAGPLRWPVPERHVTAGEILDHIHHGTLLLPQTLHRPPHAAARDITAHVSWLACNEICIPGDTTLTVAVTDAVDPAAASELDPVLAAIPGPLPAGIVQISSAPDVVEIVAPGATGITAIPGDGGPFLVDLLADGRVAGERLRLRLRPGTGTPEPLELLLVIDYPQAPRITGFIVVQ